MKPKENDWWICEIHSDQSETKKTIRYAVVYQISLLHFLFGQ